MLTRKPEEWKHWVEEFSQGKNVEAWRGIMCFLRWIQIRADNGHPVPHFLLGLEGDIFYSRLLRRLLDGKEPLPVPPPEAYGLGWYELIEEGRAIVQDVKPWEWAPDQKITINQGVWTILEKQSESDMVVSYRINGDRFLLTKLSGADWLLERVHG